jgi:phosphoribosyl 1,2-cyclic phosphodiesterase
MKFSVISSGSKANSVYLESGSSALLIDCGLSAKEALSRLDKIGADPSKIKAILVTHEHSDHIKGLSVLSRKLEVPIYANRATARFLKNVYGIENFVTGDSFVVDNFEIQPFSVVHDAVDPVGFAIVSGDFKYAQATDLGRSTTLVKSAIKDANALLLEFNYDQQKLHDCDYPWQLKQRISSTHGHLSNDDAACLLADVKAGALQHVVLGHISENSNDPSLALEAARKMVDVKDFKSFSCGSVYEPLPLWGSIVEAIHSPYLYI